MLNKLGDIIQPCLTPILTGNQSDSSLPAIMERSVLSYRFLIISTNLFGIPILSSIFQSASLQIVSNAALKSIKWKWSGIWCSLAFSINCLIINIAFVVPLPGLKPNRESLIDDSIMCEHLFINILQNILPGIGNRSMAL